MYSLQGGQLEYDLVLLPNASAVYHADVLKDDPADVPQVEVVLMVLSPAILSYKVSYIHTIPY